ncbi:uncharacterized protein LOC132192411 [Neocloeon triangulifer]|uniref:uncharacterized protein LOC132192411 n=1 Tax=Neocloeon triangulifer TaxID=2078957 RepID=UPI00286F5FB1|nr:uncharacterized protein LOC132192411 [Neocloeon triangulifer]
MASNSQTVKDEDWRLERQSLGDQLWYMFQNNICSDVEILVQGDNTEKVLKCHKVVISRLSKAMQILMRDVSEVTELVTVRTKHPHVFQIIVRYAYTDLLNLNSMADALEAHKLATAFDMRRVIQLCENYISSHVNKDTVWELMDYANKGSTFMTWAKSVLGKKTMNCLNSKNFETCSVNTLLALLKMEHLNLDSELSLVKAVIKWAKLANADQDLSPDFSKELLGPCLGQIRFLTLTAAEFSEHVARSGLLSSDDCLAILVNLASPGQMALPNWICKSQAQRKKPGNQQPEKSRPETPKPAPVKIKVYSKNKEKFSPQAKKENKPEKVQPKEVKKPSSCPSREETKSEKPVQNYKMLVCRRDVDPEYLFLTQKLEAPTDVILNFQLSKNATLLGVRMVSQTKISDDSDDLSYNESMHVMVRDMEDSNRQVAYQTFHGVIGYGSEVAIMFTTPGKLKAGVWYSMRVVIRSQGFYENHFRPNLVVTEGVKAVFNKDGDCARSANPLTALVLKL